MTAGGTQQRAPVGGAIPRHRTRETATVGDGRVRRDLEGLRALAVIGVVIYHLRPTWLPGGFAGVDVFFVLSGFLITSLLLSESEKSGRIDLLAFWGRRARRLLPAATLVALVTVGFALVATDAIDAHRFSVDALYVSVFSANWRYAQQGTSYLADPDPSPFTHYWSLGVEEQFYLIWPVAILLLALLARRIGSPRPAVRLRPLIGLLAVVVVALSFTTSLRLTAASQPYAYFGTQSRAWQLAVGALLAATVPALTRLSRRAGTLLRWAGVVTILGFYALAPLDILYPGWAATLPVIAAGLLIASGIRPSATGPRDPVLRAITSPPAQLIGRYSYGWYLWHWPPLVLLPLALNHPLNRRELIACAIGTLLVAAACYHVVEHPIRVNARLRGRPSRSLLLGVALTGLLAGAASASCAAAQHLENSTQIYTAGGRMLRPQPAVAVTEAPRPQRDGCEIPLASSSFSPECRYLPDTGHGDIVLVGDSHAAQWEPALEDVARSKRWGLRVWTRQSCPLADVTKPVGGAVKHCNAWRANIMTRLIADHPSLVMVSEFDSLPATLINPETGDRATAAAADHLELSGLEQELRRLRAARIHVMLVRDNPGFIESGPKCVLENELHLARCSRPRSQALESDTDEQAARDVPGVHLFDVTDQLCGPSECHQVVGDILAYRDANHLTIEFVKANEGQLRRDASAAMTR